MVEINVRATCRICKHAELCVCANGVTKFLCDYGDAKNVCYRWTPNKRDMRHIVWVAEQANNERAK